MSQDPTAVVTGASRGLGRALAVALGERGFQVVCAARKVSSLEGTLTELDETRRLGVACDVRDLGQVQALAVQAQERFGRIDVWVNNAGIAGPYGPTVGLESATFKSVLETNIFGSYHGSLVAIRHFVAQDSGVLVNVVGRGDTGPVPFQNAYGSTKTWLRSFTLALAKEHAATGIGVHTFQPGLMFTALTQQVQVVDGHQDALSAFGKVLRYLGNPPDVPAKRLADLIVAAPGKKTGRAWGLRGGILRAIPRLFRGGPDVDVQLETIPSARS